MWLPGVEPPISCCHCSAWLLREAAPLPLSGQPVWQSLHPSEAFLGVFSLVPHSSVKTRIPPGGAGTNVKDLERQVPSLTPGRIQGKLLTLTLLLLPTLAGPSTGSPYHWGFWHPYLHSGDGLGGLLHYRHLHTGEQAWPAPGAHPHAQGYNPALLEERPPAGTTLGQWDWGSGSSSEVQSGLSRESDPLVILGRNLEEQVGTGAR